MTVVGTDYDEIVLGLARTNLEQNAPDMVAAGNATAMPLMWGSQVRVFVCREEPIGLY